MKKQTGITLIALVITIIVLLILAGASISAITGENGIVAKAKEAVEKTEAAAEKEEQDIQEILEHVESGDWENTSDDTISVNASTIEPSDYGKIVTNYDVSSSGYTGTWQILYADNDNIYLISSTAVKTDTMYDEAMASKYESGSALLSTDTVSFPVAEKWFYTWLNSEYTVSDVKIRAVMYLLDSSEDAEWYSYADSNYADYAIGAPTMELLCAAVNDVEGTNYVPVVESASGYTQTITDGMQSGTFYCGNYWLAAPSSSLGLRIVYGCYIGSDSVTQTSADHVQGFRPVVCLNSSVVLEEDSTGTSFSIK